MTCVCLGLGGELRSLVGPWAWGLAHGRVTEGDTAHRALEDRLPPASGRGPSQSQSRCSGSTLPPPPIPAPPLPPR